MAINLDAEQAKIFTDNGYTKDQVGATVNHYRSQGLSDEEIQNKINDKLTTLQGSVEKSGNLVQEIGQGLGQIPGAVAQGIGSIIGKTVQTGANLITNPLQTVSDIPAAVVSGAASGVTDLGLGLYNLPGTISNLNGGNVKATTREDLVNAIAPQGSIQRRIGHEFAKAGQQVPLAEMAGEIAPYAYGAMETGALKAIPTVAGKLATLGLIGTPTTQLSDRITSAGANALIAPETGGRLMGKVGETIGKVANNTNKNIVSPLDEALRQNLAGISPETYNSVKSELSNPATSATAKEIYLGNDSKGISNYMKDIIFGHANAEKVVTNDITNTKNSISDLFDNPNYDINNNKALVNSAAINATNAIQEALKNLKTETGQAVGTAKENLSGITNPVQEGLPSMTEHPIPLAKGYNISDIKTGIDSIVDKFSGGIPNYIDAIGERKLVTNVHDMLSTIAETQKLNPNPQVNLSQLQQIKKYIQDETPFGGTTTTEGKALKDSLRRYVDEKITSQSEELAGANKNYSDLLNTIKELRGIDKESLATKLANSNSISGLQTRAKLDMLDSAYPELGIADHLNKIDALNNKLDISKKIKDNPLSNSDNLYKLVEKMNKGETLSTIENTNLEQLKSIMPPTKIAEIFGNNIMGNKLVGKVADVQKDINLNRNISEMQGVNHNPNVGFYGSELLLNQIPHIGHTLGASQAIIRALYTPSGQRLQLAIRQYIKEGASKVNPNILNQASKLGLTPEQTNKLFSLAIASQINTRQK